MLKFCKSFFTSSSQRIGMAIKNVQALILAAGKSTRFKTGKTKLLEKICGQEMILYPLSMLAQMNIPTTLIVGFQKESLEQIVRSKIKHPVNFVVQEEQLGTGHALMCSQAAWKEDYLLIITGDAPLITSDIIEQLYSTHCLSGAALSFVASHNADPSLHGYGRVVEHPTHVEIVEAKDFKGDVSKECCINAGIYLVNRSFLTECITTIDRNKDTAEFYATDMIKIASIQGRGVNIITAPFDRIRGINTLQELWIAEQIKRAELIKHWMDNGVYFATAQNVLIDLAVTIGSGTTIGCGVHLLGNTTIGSQCDIQAFSYVENSVVQNNTRIYPHSIIKDSTLGSHVRVGPFAHVHTNSHIADHAVIGNFVEVKNSTLDVHTKAKHLTYLGDAQIGSHVNIGAGTITCNHNGKRKTKTIIKNHAYIGSNNSLVAPITIGEHAFTAAGSVITQSVPAHALAIGRARQVIKEGYTDTLRQEKQIPETTLPASSPTNTPKSNHSIT